MKMLRFLLDLPKSERMARWFFVGATLILLTLSSIDFYLGEEVRLHALYALPVALITFCCSKKSLSVLITATAVFLQVIVIYSYSTSENAKLASSVVSVLMLCVVAALARYARSNYLAVLHLATHDSLTKLHNRRSFDLLLSFEIARQHRYGGVFSLVMLDLDEFKKLNDTRGHKTGDVALIQAAQILTNKTRLSDTVARLGGDEFAILMPSTSRRDCLEVCTQIVERIDSGMTNLGFAVTASIGSMTFIHPVESNAKALELADQALYQAKANGRNCAVCAEFNQ